MGTTDPVTKELSSLAQQEQSLRRRVVDLIGGILKSEAPMQFKAFVVILLFICLSASLFLTMFILEVILALRSPAHDVHAMKYAGILSAHAASVVFMGFPITMRMAALEEAHRLETDLGKIQAVKHRGRS